MFEIFKDNYPKRDVLSANSSGEMLNSSEVDLNEVINQLGGGSYGGGLYRVIQSSDIGEWNMRIALGFPKFRHRVTCFAYDWLGRAFALDSRRSDNDKPTILMFEPGTGEILQIPCNILDFHNEDMIRLADAILADSFYEKWIAGGGKAPHYTQCVGYRVPLFLGGEDTIDNIEIVDIEIYWHLMGQLMSQTRELPPGTILNVNISED